MSLATMCIVLPQKRLLSLAHEWSGLLLCGAQELLKAGKMQWIPDETSAIASSSYVVRFELHRFELSSSPPHLGVKHTMRNQGHY